MSEAKHTPGPWEMDHDDRPGMEWNIHIVQQAAPDLRICFMTSDGQCEANARLISAAPDLLEALQGMLDVAEGKTETGWHQIEAARAVIAKATNPPPTVGGMEKIDDGLYA